MSDDPRILLTNDDGIDHPGIAAMAEALSAVGSVTTVAPADDQSGVGRQGSYEVTVRNREDGYAVEGTPCDCVRYGLRGLDAEFDLVVSGCNDGPNFGAFKLGRSGTVSAAVEAAYLDTPGIAVSAYDPVTGGLEKMDDADFEFAREVVPELARTALSAGVFDRADLLSVHVPTEPADEVRITRPLEDYEIGVDQDGDEVSFSKPFYDPMTADDPAGRLEAMGERDTDRRALADVAVSVAPVALGHGTPEVPELGSVLDDLVPKGPE